MNTSDVILSVASNNVSCQFVKFAIFHSTAGVRIFFRIAFRGEAVGVGEVEKCDEKSSVKVLARQQLNALNSSC